MDRNGKLLRRAALVLFAFFAAAFLRPVPASALKAYSTEDLGARVAAYAVQAVELGLDFGSISAFWTPNIEAMNGTAASFANWRHLAYGDDHRTVSDRRSYFGSGYESNFNGWYGGGDMMGYREPDRPRDPDRPPDEPYRPHAELYRQRAADWRDVMKGILAGNNYALNDILNLETKIAPVLSGARNNGAGYTRRAGEAAYLEAMLDDELLKLNADIDRRLALETRIALNEQLERSDAAAAYGLAVGDWRPVTLTPGGGY